jgi:hypothetical protein
MSNLSLDIANNRLRKSYRNGRGLSSYINTGPENMVNINNRSVAYRASFNPYGTNGRLTASLSGPAGVGYNGNAVTLPSSRSGNIFNNINFNIANNSLSNPYSYIIPYNPNDFRGQTSVYEEIDPRLRLYPNSYSNGYPVLNANNYGQLQTYSNGYPAPGQLSTYNYPYGQIFGYYPVAGNQIASYY